MGQGTTYGVQEARMPSGCATAVWRKAVLMSPQGMQRRPFSRYPRHFGSAGCTLLATHVEGQQLVDGILQGCKWAVEVGGANALAVLHYAVQCPLLGLALSLRQLLPW